MDKCKKQVILKNIQKNIQKNMKNMKKYFLKLLKIFFISKIKWKVPLLKPPRHSRVRIVVL